MTALEKTDVLALTPENLTQLMQHPLLAVPKELRPATWNVWIVSQHLFPTPLPLASAIATDISQGLEYRDAAAILEAMLDSELRAQFRFAADFMVELAKRTGLAIKRRKTERETLERRKRFEEDRSQSTGNKSKANEIIQSVAEGFR